LPEHGAPADAHVRHTALDLLDPEQVARTLKDARPEVAFLCAWTTEHGKFWQDTSNAAWASATEHLARELLDRGTRLVVGFGTCAEYDWSASLEAGYDEGHGPFAPATAYGQAKLATAGWLASQAPEQHLWCRIFLIHGPGENPARVVPAVCQGLLERRPVRLGPCEQVVNLVHAEDAAAQVMALTVSPVRGPVNLGSARAAPLRDLLRELAAGTCGDSLLEFGALPARPGEPPYLVPSLEKLKRACPSLPDPILGLERTLEYWAQRLAAR
jgi:nucleoside-diphosphate-sugar epimerase